MTEVGTEGVVALVPTFRPPESVIRLLAQLQTMVGTTVVSDDASPATFDELLRSSPVPVIRHREREGIARSLNIGLATALESDAQWLLSVDQDSDLPAQYVDHLLATARSAQEAGLIVGVVAAQTVNIPGADLGYPERYDAGHLVTAEVFQSGSLWSVAALAEIGGFDESFGVDAVDAAACLRLRERGYRIVLAAGTSFHHRYGAGIPIRAFGRTVISTRHSPDRRTGMVHNRLRLLPAEARQDPAQAWRSLRRLAVNTALAVSVEGDRWESTKATIRGFRPRRHR